MGNHVNTAKIKAVASRVFLIIAAVLTAKFVTVAIDTFFYGFFDGGLVKAIFNIKFIFFAAIGIGAAFLVKVLYYIAFSACEEIENPSESIDIICMVILTICTAVTLIAYVITIINFIKYLKLIYAVFGIDLMLIAAFYEPIKIAMIAWLAAAIGAAFLPISVVKDADKHPFAFLVVLLNMKLAGLEGEESDHKEEKNTAEETANAAAENMNRANSAIIPQKQDDSAK